MTTYSISTPPGGLRYQAKQELNGGALFVKNSSIAYRLTSSGFTQITDVDYPKSTVWGVVYLDGYMFVQESSSGRIYNSDSLDSTSWGALNYIVPEKEPSLAVAIAKSLNYLVAFKSWDTEFYYDAGNAAPGSPLSTVDSSYLKLGCASADSIIEFDGGIVFMSKRDNNQRSREIHVLNGLTPKKISTPEIERLINGDDLSTLYALYLSTAGHQFYVLTLKTLGITIVYDFNNGEWYQWTMLTAATAQSVSASNLTSSSGIATCTITAHGFSDGDTVTVAGANQSQYNGDQVVTISDANTFTYPIDDTPVSPATGTITATGYTESYFAFVSYAQFANVDLVQHETNGIIYALAPSLFKDDGTPIQFVLHTQNWDNGNNYRKTVNSVRLVGDKVTGTGYIRYSDDDSLTNSSYRPIDLSVQSAAMWRMGQTRRRNYDVKYIDDTAVRFEAIEQFFTQDQ